VLDLCLLRYLLFQARGQAEGVSLLQVSRSHCSS